MQNVSCSRQALHLALLGVAVGACTGAISIAFRRTIELCHTLTLPSAGFAAADSTLRFALPVLGTAVAVCVLKFVADGPVPTGVPHVLERLRAAGGRLPFRNAMLQFVAGSLLLGFGMSMGREGPAIHLGAASGSIVGSRLALSPSSLRILVGCGVSAAIGAAFNTPLAGVILAIEVILIEYTVGGFAPILLAALTGAVLGRLVYGDAPAFHVPALVPGSLLELAWLALMGLAAGAYSAVFMKLTSALLRRTRSMPWYGVMMAASVGVGLLGMFVPEILGVGYDVIQRVLDDEYGVIAVALIAAVKLVATAACVGARVPAGLIGPTLVMGAALGGVFGTLGTTLVSGGTSTSAFYAMLGMAAVMGATLRAPMSALVAVLELTGNPHVILPGILAIVTASLTARHVFGCDSVFAIQLRDLEAACREPLRRAM
jgi:H+/Cl- antiporter ClcA